MKHYFSKVVAVLLIAGLTLSGCGNSAANNQNEQQNQTEEAKIDNTEETQENSENQVDVNTEDVFEDTQSMGEVIDIEDEAVALASSDAALSKVILPVASGKKVEENSDMVIDYSNTDKGYVMVKYKKSTSVKLKAQVTGNSKTTYTYNLTAKKWAAFPLSDGDGSYKVCVFKNISGTSYATVGSVTFKADLEDPKAPFMTANQYVNYDSDSKCVKKANTLCKNVTTEMGKVKKIYKWTLSYFSYDTKKAKSVESGYLPDLDKVYKAKKGICFDYASTMVAMLRSQGVPTKLVIGYSGSVYHAWINVYTKKSGWVTGAIYFDGKDWNLMDPTFADSANSSKEIMDYIGNGKNYTAKYIY